jgi:hypothetical protein
MTSTQHFFDIRWVGDVDPMRNQTMRCVRNHARENKKSLKIRRQQLAADLLEHIL